MMKKKEKKFDLNVDFFISFLALVFIVFVHSYTDF